MIQQINIVTLKSRIDTQYIIYAYEPGLRKIVQNNAMITDRPRLDIPSLALPAKQSGYASILPKLAVDVTKMCRIENDSNSCPRC